MSAPQLVAEFATADEYLAVHEEEVAAGGLLVRGAVLPPGTSLSDCSLVVRIAGAAVAELPAKLAGATPGLGVMVLFLTEPAPLLALAERLRAPPAPEQGPLSAPEHGPLSAPEQKGPARPAMTLQEKMHLAMSGDRELRFQLLRDPNKQLHPMVLKNPRIGLEEVHWAAKLTTLNPDALKLIADHPEWGQNPGVAAALVRNPKTPVPVALKLLSRLPSAELRALAKSQGRPPIVQAARKLILR